LDFKQTIPHEVLKLYYKKYGSGPPLVILHGLFGMGDNWRTFSKKVEHQFECFLIDLRNHGRSPHDPVMNLQAMTEDVYQWMTDSGIHKATFLGHSLGGKIAMQFALRYPEKVEKLIVVDIAPKSYPLLHDKVFEAIESIRPDMVTDRAAAAQQLSLILGNDPTMIQFLLKNLTRLSRGGFAWKANMPVIIETYEDLMQNVIGSDPYKGAVLFVKGENSDYIQPEDVSLIQRFFPHAVLITIPKAGHWVHADTPEVFAQELISFLNQEEQE
jgi:pimeloyl-ACP methyl ester carboxylesterase